MFDPSPPVATGGMQSQLVCIGCRNLLLYPRGATNVCCAICNTITPAPPPDIWHQEAREGRGLLSKLYGLCSLILSRSQCNGFWLEVFTVGYGTEMAQIICGGCRTLLMYTRGAATVRCSCCHTINLAVAEDAGRYHSATNQVAHINCGQCHTTLMYPYGAPSVKCSICQYVTNTGMTNARPIPMFRPNGSVPPHPSTSSPFLPQQNQTVVVENPMSVDERGKLVSNVVVGVSTEKK